jgi:hypothetical protein
MGGVEWGIAIGYIAQLAIDQVSAVAGLEEEGMPDVTDRVQDWCNFATDSKADVERRFHELKDLLIVEARDIQAQREILEREKKDLESVPNMAEFRADRELKSKIDNLERTIKQMQAEHAAQLESMRKDHTTALELLKTQHKAEIKKLDDELAATEQAMYSLAMTGIKPVGKSKR